MVVPDADQACRRRVASAVSAACSLLLAVVLPAQETTEPVGLPDLSGLVITGVRYGPAAHVGLYRLAADHNSFEEIIPGGSYAKYSPDRQYLAFVRGGSVWVRFPDGSLRCCVRYEAPWPGPRHLAWDEAGRALYFPGTCVDGIGSPSRMRLVRAPLNSFNGSYGAARPLDPRHEADQCFPAVSSRGNIALAEVSWSHYLGFRRSKLYMSDDRGLGWRRVTDLGPEQLELSPSFSADGTMMAFDVLDRKSGIRTAHVYHFGPERMEPIVSPREDLKDTWALCWQPGSACLLVGIGTGRDGAHPGTAGLWRGGAVQPIPGGGLWDAVWSPDGSRIALIKPDGDTPRDDPGGTAEVMRAVEVYDISTNTAEIVLSVSFGGAVDDMNRFDPIVPVDLEW